MSVANHTKSVHQRLLNVRDRTEEQFNHLLLREAIHATFNRRNVSLPDEMPVAFSPEFLEDGIKEIQWRAFLRRSSLSSFGLDLATVLAGLKKRLWPLLSAANSRGLRQGC